MNIQKINLQALQAAEQCLHCHLNEGFRGQGIIPLHYKRTREEAEAALSLVRLAIQNAKLMGAS